MIELPVTLTSTGGAVSFASPVTLGYTKNKGVYRLLITAEGEWQGLTIRCFWHLPGGTDPASSLVQDGFVGVPASVTAQPGTGCITFEGSDGEKTVTSADLRYKVGGNSGTEDGTMPEPGTPAWEQLVSETKANAEAAEQAKNDAQAAAEGVKTAAAKADEAASAAAKSAQKAEEAQKATERAEAAAAESIAVAKEKALSAISTGEQGALSAVQQAQTTATEAVQAAQTAAESAVSAAKTNAVQEVEAASKPAQTAAAKAEEAAERSTQAGIAASNAADDAAGSAVAAGNAASAAADSESAAAKSAQAALESKTAAATSEGNAAASAKKAQDVADSLPADYVTAVNDIAALKTNKADKADLETVRKWIGNLDDLTTKAKETLVAAINEAARTGAAMRTDGGYIQYSTDDGSTWENLIALAELKGEPGQNGADGVPGADGYSPTASVEQSTDGAKITITDKSGTTEVQVLNGKDGRDGTDGAPGRDGVDGQPGKDGTDGITPTIGDNGNWFLGETDTGKPSHGKDAVIPEDYPQIRKDVSKYIIAKYSGSVITSREPYILLRYACPISKGDKVSIKSEYDGDNIKKYDIRFYDVSGNIHVIAQSVQVAENYTFVSEDNYSEISLYSEIDNIVEGMRFATIVSVDGVVLNDIHDLRVKQDVQSTELTDTKDSINNKYDKEFVNILDVAKAIANKSIDADTGAAVDNSTGYWLASDFVKLNANTRYYCNGIFLNGIFGFYTSKDANTFVKSPAGVEVHGLSAWTYKKGYIETGSSEIYFRGSIASEMKDSAYISEWVDEYVLHTALQLKDFVHIAAEGSKLKGKKILVIGDSISTDYYGSYPKWVTALIKAHYLPLDTVNNSIHATGFVADAGTAGNDFFSRLKSVENKSSFDLVIVFGGINDYSLYKQEDSISTIFTNAVDAFFEYLVNNYVNARFGVIKPMLCNRPGAADNAHKIRLYADYIAGAAKKYAIPALNMTDESGFNPFITQLYERWSLLPSGQELHDGIHPNEEFERKFMAPQIKHFIDGLI